MWRQLRARLWHLHRSADARHELEAQFRVAVDDVAAVVESIEVNGERVVPVAGGKAGKLAAVSEEAGNFPGEEAGAEDADVEGCLTCGVELPASLEIDAVNENRLRLSDDLIWHDFSPT